MDGVSKRGRVLRETAEEHRRAERTREIEYGSDGGMKMTRDVAWPTK